MNEEIHSTATMDEAIQRIDTITDLQGNRPTRWEYLWLNPNGRRLDEDEAFRVAWRPLDVYWDRDTPSWDRVRRELIDTLHYRTDKANAPIYAIRPVWETLQFGEAFNGG